MTEFTRGYEFRMCSQGETRLGVFTEVIGWLKQPGNPMEKESVRLVIQLNWLVTCIVEWPRPG